MFSEFLWSPPSLQSLFMLAGAKVDMNGSTVWVKDSRFGEHIHHGDFGKPLRGIVVVVHKHQPWSHCGLVKSIGPRADLTRKTLRNLLVTQGVSGDGLHRQHAQEQDP